MKKRLEDMSLQELWELFPIVLVAPDPTWKKQFREEKKTLEKLLGKKALGIYHIGSTAVGTIVAKPIVDIIVETDDPKAAADILAGSGYIVMLRNEDRISLNKGYTVDGYADKVMPGNKAIVRIGKNELTGTVGNVVPSVNDGMINFMVFLDDNSHKRLRSGLKVDVFVVNEVRDETLRLERRSFYNGAGDYELWVIKDGEAVKRSVKLGEGSYDYVEVLEGLNPGDQVIISDMNKFRDKDNLKVK